MATSSNLGCLCFLAPSYVEFLNKSLHFVVMFIQLFLCLLVIRSVFNGVGLIEWGNLGVFSLGVLQFINLRAILFIILEFLFEKSLDFQ